MASLVKRMKNKDNYGSASPLNEMHPAYDSLRDGSDDDDGQHKTTVIECTDLKINIDDGEQATQPFFNNQNTILMAARSHNGDLMLMHETRIFYFRRQGKGKKNKNEEYADAVNHMTNLILGMLTTRKYRLLTSFYLLWRVLDYAMLAALVMALFFEKDSAHHTQRFQDVVWNNVLIFCVVAIEIFYDVLEFIVKIWLLNRVSIYVGMALYILYCLAFTWPTWEDSDSIWDELVYVLLGLRFVAFIFEELIDFCIDLELEYDFAEGMIHKLEVPICIKTEFEENIAMKGVGKDCTLKFAKGWKFKGSVCVWSPKNTFKCPVQKQNCCGTKYRILFHFMFAITYCIIGIPLLIIILISVLLLTLVRVITRQRTDTILDECFHRYSY